MRNLFMFCLATLSIAAGAGENFAYQAVLCNATGQPLGSQSTTVRICLYSQATGGTALWAREAIPVLTDANGLVNIELSDGIGQKVSGVTNTLDKVFAKAAGEGSALYLGLTVAGSSGEIRPRQRMLTTPLASVARDGAGSTGDFVIKGAAVVTGETTFGATNAVQIGKKATFQRRATFKGNTTFQSGVALTGGDLGSMPVGTVVMWWGDPAKLPTGWALCNGASMPGGGNAPNFVSRFPLGAGTGGDYAKGAQGGAEKVTLTIAQMPRHQHEFAGSDVEGVEEGDSHPYTKLRDITDTNGLTRAGMSHASTHCFRKYNTGNNGGGQPHENMPPYRALYFIIKVK